MKKFFAAAAVFTLILVSFVSAAAAEQFDGFTINFPDDFTGAYTDVDTDIQSDFFTDNLLYETASDYEVMRVMVGESTSLNSLFSEDFGFANRQDLDLSLLTEKQLADEADMLASYIGRSTKLYMTYVTPTSMVVDGRLGLVVSGYFTDYEGGLTGEFRAYEFYYMGNVVIVYYDTQIEGTYFVESVYDLPDSIVQTLDFDLNPTTQPVNAALYRQLLNTAAPVAGLLVLAVLLGALFGRLLRKRPEAETGGIAALFGLEKTPVEETPKNQKKQKQPIDAPAADTEPAPVTVIKEKTAAPAPVVPTTDAGSEEAVDWNSMLSALKNETVSAKAEPAPAEVLRTEAPEVTPEPEAQTAPKPEIMTDAPEITVAEPKMTPEEPELIVTEKKSFDFSEPEKTAPISAPEPLTMKKNSESDALLAQLKAMDDMSLEISAALDSLETLGKNAKSAAPAKKETETSTASAAKPPTASVVKPASAPAAAPESNPAPVIPEPALPQSKNAEKVSENYQSYMDSLLPTRKKAVKKTEDVAPAKAEKPKAPPAEPRGNFREQALGTDDGNSASPGVSAAPPKAARAEKKEKKPGIFSRMLTSVADQIEQDGEVPTEPEFDSRMEMHISEKTERNSVEKLMPGLFDNSPEEEKVEILLDQSEDLKFERSKKKPQKTEDERNEILKKRVDNLFND